MKEEILAIAELIGVSIEIIQAAHESYIGIKGNVVDETKNTFLIEKEPEMKLIRVPKKNIKFKFTEEGKSIEVDGNLLLHHPEDRLKKVK
ncbi:MAG: ribonuclease P protein subunit [Candidatus Thermoplasmatota archaeon]|nr:ribonuclease P protein subunit [Candidatus Thermoplasmatota archaeon]